MVRAINQYTLLRERKTGRIGQIKSFRLDLKPSNVVVLVQFEGESNPVNFTGLHNIIDSFEIVRRVNGKIHTVEIDRMQVLEQPADLEGNRFQEQSRTVEDE